MNNIFMPYSVYEHENLISEHAPQIMFNFLLVRSLHYGLFMRTNKMYPTFYGIFSENKNLCLILLNSFQWFQGFLSKNGLQTYPGKSFTKA